MSESATENINLLNNSRINSSDVLIEQDMSWSKAQIRIGTNNVFDALKMCNISSN